MLPLFFCEQGATAPVGNWGGVSITKNSVATGGWTVIGWFGGKQLGSFSGTRLIDGLQRAIILIQSYNVDKFYDTDPDN